MEYTEYKNAEEEAGYLVQHRALQIMDLARDYTELGSNKAANNCIAIANILNAVGKGLADGTISFEREEGESK